MVIVLFILVVGGSLGALNLKPVYAGISVPKTVNCGIGIKGSEKVYIGHNEGDYIKNLKSGNSNMKVKYEGVFYSTSTLGIYCKKAGTYKFSFDLYTKKNIKRNNYTVTVYADKCLRGTDGLMKGVQFDGKDITDNILVWGPDSSLKDYYTSKKSAKVKIIPAKGVTLKRIQIGMRGKNGKYNFKTVKNGSKITFGTYGEISSSTWMEEKTKNKSLYATSRLRISLKRPGSSEVLDLEISINTPASAWVEVKD